MKPDKMERHLLRPLLQRMAAHDPRLKTEASIVLLQGTMAQESDYCRHSTQIGGGPGRGPCQVESLTEQDTRKRYIPRHPELQKILLELVPMGAGQSDEYFDVQLETNWSYNIFIARLKYWMIPAAMPDTGNLQALAEYWDKYFNANPNYGTPQEWLEAYDRYIIQG